MQVIWTLVETSQVVPVGFDNCTASPHAASSGPLVVPSWVTKNSRPMLSPGATPSVDNESRPSVNVPSAMPIAFGPACTADQAEPVQR